MDYEFLNSSIDREKIILPDSDKINRLIDIDLKGAIIGSKIAMNQMIKQGFGQIYGIEGYGSNDAMML